MDNRSIDALVAETVMGLRVLDLGSDRPGVEIPDVEHPCGGTYTEYDDLPRYSTDIAAAWAVKIAMNEKGFRLMLVEYSDGLYVKFAQDKHEETAWQVEQWPIAEIAEAICLAALKAAGVGVGG